MISVVLCNLRYRKWECMGCEWARYLLGGKAKGLAAWRGIPAFGNTIEAPHLLLFSSPEAEGQRMDWKHGSRVAITDSGFL
jgi:hypothetical protein